MMSRAEVEALPFNHPIRRALRASGQREQARTATTPREPGVVTLAGGLRVALPSHRAPAPAASPPTPPKRPRARPCSEGGRSFDSRLELRVYRMLREGLPAGHRILDHVRFPLLAIINDGERPVTWEVDFLVGDGATWVAHEAKAPRVVESRDFPLRLRAFRASFPNIRVHVWRDADGELQSSAY